MERIPSGLYTGIGSMPHTDAESAVSLILRHFPDAPFWPQLPKLGAEEGMVAQFSEGIPCLKLEGKSVVFRPDREDEELALFYERIIAEDIDYFAISPSFSKGIKVFSDMLRRQQTKLPFIKGQITGPFTFAGSIRGADERPLLYNPLWLQAITQGLAMKARWQAKNFLPFCQQLILFIDEPYLAGLGSAYSAISGDEVIRVLNEFCAAIKETQICLGVHCCGNTDWSLFLEVRRLRIISFDAYGFWQRLVLYANQLKKFLQEGGVLCWGILPVSDPAGLDILSVQQHFKDAIESFIQKGIDKELLLKQIMLSPACGLAGLNELILDDYLNMLSCLAEYVKKI